MSKGKQLHDKRADLKQKDIKLKTPWDPIDEFENIFRILISESSAESGGLSVGLDGVPVYTSSSRSHETRIPAPFISSSV